MLVRGTPVNVVLVGAPPIDGVFESYVYGTLVVRAGNSVLVIPQRSFTYFAAPATGLVTGEQPELPPHRHPDVPQQIAPVPVAVAAPVASPPAAPAICGLVNPANGAKCILAPHGNEMNHSAGEPAPQAPVAPSPVVGQPTQAPIAVSTAPAAGYVPELGDIAEFPTADGKRARGVVKMVTARKRTCDIKIDGVRARIPDVSFDVLTYVGKSAEAGVAPAAPIVPAPVPQNAPVAAAPTSFPSSPLAPQPGGAAQPAPYAAPPMTPQPVSAGAPPWTSQAPAAQQAEVDRLFRGVEGGSVPSPAPTAPAGGGTPGGWDQKWQ